ncbi:hypothetical protein [Micromonospora auratinigra]|nr:hypothetical protein [Micromonospora auratinigra]
MAQLRCSAMEAQGRRIAWLRQVTRGVPHDGIEAAVVPRPDS